KMAGEILSQKAAESKEEKEIYQKETAKLFPQAQNDFQKGDSKKALDKLSLLLQLSPSHSEALLLKKEIEGGMIKEREREEVEKDKLSDMYFQKGIKAYRKGEMESALYYFDRVKELTPERIEDNKLKDVLSKIYGKEKREKNVDSKKVRFFNEGIKYYKQKRYQDTIKKMREVLKLDSRNKEALDFIRKSEEYLERAKVKPVSERNKRLSSKHYTKGINYYKNNENELAIREWRIALVLNPNNEKAKESLKSILKKKNE
ncbi:MAG: hypothetical protein KKH98_05220, partial [Spirochaetes bacterium]|nr:hypothetical protein [Spirochaetota bacterium]